VGEIASKLVVSDRTRANLEKGYAGLAQSLNFSPKYARGLAFLGAVRSLHTQQMAAINEVRDLIAKLPTPEQQGVAMKMQHGLK
jgi:hypothetical protein